MTDALLAAGVAAATSLIVASFAPWVARSVEASRDRSRLAATVNLEHLAPLRQQLAEAAFRNHEVLLWARRDDAHQLDCLDEFPDLQGKSTEWFAGLGCHLMSTTYLTACLFAELIRLRDAFPFLQLRDRDRDAELAALTLRVRLALAGEGGVYYAVQAAIGQDMITPDGAVLSYPDFCTAVRDHERGVWYRQLVDFYCHVGRGERLDRLERAVAAMLELSRVLDQAVGASASVADRLREERTTPSS
jgi:hypothetical protein